MRRLSCARTRFSLRSWASLTASVIACSVISWNTIRFTGTFGFVDLAFSPDGKFLMGKEVLGPAGNLEVWNLAQDEESLTKREVAYQAYWSPDSEAVVYFQTDRFQRTANLRLWDLRGQFRMWVKG